VKLPKVMQPHTMLFEPYVGDDATGHLYGPPTARRCYAEALTRSIRTPDGRLIVSGTVLRTDLDYTLGTEGRLTYRGSVREVVSVRQFDGGGMGTPDHTEIVIQ
jgi:hypothetical protein